MKIISQISTFDYEEIEILGDLERCKLLIDNVPDREIVSYEYHMDKIKELWYSGDKEYEFLTIFDFDKEELKKVGSGDKYMTEFKKKIEGLNNNKRYKEFLSVEEDMRKTNNTFKEIGALEEKRHIAKNLLNMKMSLKDISIATGLTEEEIHKLQEEF